MNLWRRDNRGCIRRSKENLKGMKEAWPADKKVSFFLRQYAI